MVSPGVTLVALTKKLCETGGAGAKVALSPGWVAVMLQVPASRNVMFAPDTVQTLVVVDAKATVKPEVAVAVSVNGVPTTCVPGLLKVMVCVGSGARIAMVSVAWGDA